ncbi:hypothetical protein FRC14_008164 [Serendipita sp. 396]|nr:hypothetical protein FRC14_008164 [Serendipita sp. 396]KAG8826180.1 hypothetical protein FRC19_009530 [Serendipita sp. 401]KAG9056972.1 hypothetical protein FS842_008998 [Serendipita sp. 407]
MSLRTAATVASRVPRASSTMTTARLATRNPSLIPATRRNVGGTSTPPHTKKSRDVPLIVGGIVVLVPLAYYFVGRSASTHGDNIANDAAKVPVSEKISGGTTTGEIRDNIQAASSGDSKTGYKPNPTGAIQKDRMRGDTPSDDVNESIKKSLQVDAPKTAYKAEEEKAKMK